MNEEERTTYQDSQKLLRVYQQGHDYYFQVGDTEVRGPFVEEVEAYQECIRDLMELLIKGFETILCFEESIEIAKEAFKLRDACSLTKN